MGRALGYRVTRIIAAAVALAASGFGAGRAGTGFGDLHYRWLGPALFGGRLDVVAGIPGDYKTIYAGHSSGGLWKSTDGGLTFDSVFETGRSSAVGAIAIDPHDARTVYIGTGESFPRNTAQPGDGLWVSHDAAKSWKHLGFESGGSITRIAVDPRDSRILLVAVLGNEFAPSPQRGIYRTQDGGKSWRRVVFVNETTGGSDVAFDPKNPNVAYAGTFDFLRRPWNMRSGGPGSGLYKSRDGGRTWTLLTDPKLANGLPTGPINRVGLSICAGDPRVVYAYLPVKHGMLYRTTDAGAHWSLQNADQEINFRPFYFSQVRCDPHDTERVYAIGGGLLVSKDGGKKFSYAGGGGDNHDLWIDPHDSAHLLNGSDMGLDISLNRGKTWNYADVVPFAQTYRVGYDMADPYHVMGGFQDHEVWWGPSNAYDNDGVYGADWRNISDWGDGQYAMADPSDPSTVYEDTHFGDLVRANLTTGERRYISPQPIESFGTGAKTYPYRFSWSAPLLVSRVIPHTLYFGGNYLFASNDRGETWRAISPDLTHCSAGRLESSGGPITHDNTNAETYCTVYAIAEDPSDPRTLWIGTDTGYVDVTRDGGASWKESALPDVPAGESRVSSLSASPTQSGTAYVCVDRHEWNDLAPHAYATNDYGKSWHRIDAGLDGYVHVVREDPRNGDVLYAGTERGIFVSFDRGAHWQSFNLGLPAIPVYDLQVHPRDNDLIVGSHGRGFYVLDDLTPVQQYARLRGNEVYVFPPMPATRFAQGFARDSGRGEFVVPSKPEGAAITFYLAKTPAVAPKAKPAVRVRVYAGSKLIDEFRTPAHAGLNRTVWDLHTLAPAGVSTIQDPRPYYIFYSLANTGPKVPPGQYTVEVASGDAAARANVTVRMDPKHPVSTPELLGQADALERIDAAQAEAERTISELTGAQKKLARLGPRGRSAGERVAALLDRLRNPESSGYRQPARPVEQLGYLRHTIEQYDGAPTAAQNDAIQTCAKEIAAVQQEWAVLRREASQELVTIP